jgi:epidermal growth factor receptor substrate 15
LLTPAGFGIVLRLIGHYQAGQDPTPELAFRPGPLPKFDGALGGASTIQPPPGPPPGQLQAQTSGGPIRVPPLLPEKVNQYAALFEKSGAQNGVLPGEQAKQIFERAGLPNEVLGRIWNLADTEQRGALVMTEFIIAMHLLASFKAGALRALPNILPAGLYEAAARRGPVRQLTNPPVSPISAIPRQFSGAGAGRTGSPLARSGYSTPQQTAQTTGQGGNWDITPADKANFDNIYSGLDKANKGFITGDEAVPFFGNSKLPEEVLAQIWDLADINSLGRLTRDEFAVAMYLIRQQRSKRDGRDTLPSALPPSLIPPSMRNQIRPPQQATAPTFEPAPPTMPKSAADDLFGLDALSGSPPPPAQAPMSTGGSTGFNDPFGNARSPLAPSSPVQTGSPQQQTQSTFRPFVPSSTFGQSLSYQATGGSNNSGPAQQSRAAPSTMDDLLGDNDPEISKKLTNETTELANLSNQVGTLSKQMQEVQGQRSSTQNELTQATSQKREFEQRLGQLRSLYEKEAKDVKGLQESLAIARTETNKIKQEIAMREGAHKDLQVQHQQIFSALQADQQENASLKERMKVLNAEIAQMKPQLEKLRSEARQQKGLVAINKKQLSTNEAERDKLKTESEELTKSNEENARAIAESSRVQSPTPAAVASPALSTMSANNPFFKRQGSMGSISEMGSPYGQPPAPASQQERSFENVFGPSYTSTPPIHSATMPPTTFSRTDSASPESNRSANIPLRSATGNTSLAPSMSPQGGSINSRDISGQSEPPAPPESRQISSSYLPFPNERADSLSSSRQVSAPASRFGEGSTTGADTPTSYTGTTPTGAAVSSQLESPFDRQATASPAVSDARSIPASKESIPGAFPGDVNSHIAATPTGGSSTLSEQAMGNNASDPFAPSKATPAAAKDDFDSAFAGFGGPSTTKEKQLPSEPSADGSAKGAEFPPLREFEDDDDSDSDDSQGGFEDDFTSASAGHSRNVSKAEPEPESTPSVSSAADGAGGLQTPRPTITHNSSAMSLGADPPTPNAQSSPPPYDKTVSPHDRAQAEVDQYSGLLPDRGDPTSPTVTDHSFSVPSAAGGTGADLFSTAPAPALVPQTAAVTAAPAPPAAPAKIPVDDSDDDFDDLEDAKEGDADDDFANISVHDRSGMLDFDPTFDSPVASKASQHTAQGSNGFGSDSAVFGDFTQSPISGSAISQPPPNAGAAAAVNDAHDWDAIFAGLDTPSNNNAAPATVPTTAAAPQDEISALPTSTLNGTGGTLAPARPELGRALTNTGEHDDPILKELTGMGYPRKDALDALEKYDYNLERVSYIHYRSECTVEPSNIVSQAANFLASQS